MKRKDPPAAKQSPAKKKRPDLPDYHSTPMLQDDRGENIWPAPREQMKHARQIITECAKANAETVICPDKDADGLTSGVILYRTLLLLGMSPDLIKVHLLQKGSTIHAESERDKLEQYKPRFVFVLDQGSRHSPPLVRSPETTTLVVDHHFATENDFPEGSTFVTACNSPPVVTTSLLVYLLCRELHPLVEEQCNWLAIVGTHGDLGTTLKWSAPFPDMSVPLKAYTKKALNDVVAAVNAPRRTATYDVLSAWTALLTADHPKDVLKHSRLHAAREEVASEVERCTHTAPKFSPDGKIAVFRISSKCQVHPVIATRWAGHLNSKALEIVMVANEGYLEGKVNFSCRIARCARAREDEVNIIKSLKAYASEAQVPLLDRLGDDFARGHVQASGGIVSTAEFEELLKLMRIGEKSDAQKKREADRADQTKSPAKKKKAIDAEQTNTLMGYFGTKDKKKVEVT
ncbi:DHH family protein [Myriangium duriaei CBS 260.36]|uniref:DHH family protein n=1 Tax=Myriangium duriaei CBS 260.36 TaxID=1168546 RepID=A0A9P4JA73_9PEZI|nr:DHH family protein [Myriangium duriaei CBS 260.36]